MIEFNLKKNIVSTILTKGLILLLNFGVVIFTTQMFGTEGRGLIAIFSADISMIAIFSNVLTNSSVAYYLSKFGHSRLATLAYLWVFIISSIAAIILHFATDSVFTLPLFIVSVLFGFITFHNSLFIGKQKILYYNVLTLLQPALLIVFLFGFYFLFPQVGCYSYFYAQIVAYSIAFVVAKIFTWKTFRRTHFEFSTEALKLSLNFGWKVELSALLQFFNYRLSYYLLEYYTDISSVGVFSIGVTISEAVWIFSRSMSLVQYSNVIKQGDTENSKKETKVISWYAFLASLLCVAVAICIPKFVFGFVFGSGFEDVKNIILILSPGILAIAASNVVGNYFSAIGKLNILILKSGLGLVVTLIFSIILIPRMAVIGACIVNSVSYIVSSLVLFIYFAKKTS